MTALRLYKKHNKHELIEMARQIAEDAQNHAPSGIHRLLPAARKRLAAIDQAIAWHMEDDRKQAGRAVPVCGYSGRQTNRGA